MHILQAEVCNLMCLSGWLGHPLPHAALFECALKLLSLHSRALCRPMHSVGFLLTDGHDTISSPM